MTTKFILFFLALGQINFASAQNLNGQSYILSDKLANECSVELQCDCCLTDLIFLTDKEFALVGYCEGGGTYQIGTYKAHGDKLSLTFKQFFVSEETDFLVEKREIKKKQFKTDPLEFKMSICGQQIDKIENLKIQVYRHGFKRKSSDSDSAIKKLKSSKAWKLLVS